MRFPSLSAAKKVFFTGFLVAGLFSCGKEEAPVPEPMVRPVKMMTIESKAEGIARSYPGRVRAEKRVDLAFQVDGTLTKIPVEEGQRVEKNVLLAQLDPKDFETALRNAEGQLGKAKAALELARSEYQRVLRIREKDPGAVSGSMVDQKKEGVDRAEAEIRSLQAAVDNARNQLGYTSLKAPFAGVVSKRYVDNFQEVRAKQTIVSLDDIDKVEIVVDVPENVMATIKEGTENKSKIFAEFAAAPGKQYEMTVKEFSTRADPKTQTYQVTFQMEQPKGINVLPGMAATVRGTEAAEGGGVLVIPAIAVFADSSGQANVWVVDRQTGLVHQQKVTTGDLTGTAGIQILDGLQSGETIAVSGASQLREGMKVRPFNP
jgi:RND family efflux transporter MFP subunit